MPKIRFVSGGPHMEADRKTPLMWELSRQPGLSEELYVFVPGIWVQVTDKDAAWLLDTRNTRGRVFELAGGQKPAQAGGAASDASAASAAAGNGQGGSAPSSERAGDAAKLASDALPPRSEAPAADAAPKPQITHPSGQKPVQAGAR